MGPFYVRPFFFFFFMYQTRPGQTLKTKETWTQTRVPRKSDRGLIPTHMSKELSGPFRRIISRVLVDQYGRGQHFGSIGHLETQMKAVLYTPQVACRWSKTISVAERVFKQRAAAAAAHLFRKADLSSSDQHHSAAHVDVSVPQQSKVAFLSIEGVQDSSLDRTKIFISYHRFGIPCDSITLHSINVQS